MKLNEKNKELDFRVSVLPTLFGEKIVLRLLDKDNLRLDMTKLGFEPESLAKFEEAIFKPWGMVLVTGPTGSGKTNTLYSALSKVNSPEVNIMTAEDPVEFNLPGINQVQMKESIGLNFAATLRSFLRQDPNIILVGEIRDFETAEIAIKAALTGHLVLSTLHTNDAPSTINRLMNMGIEPFLVATSVQLIAAQRLARRICAACKEAVDMTPQALITLEACSSSMSATRRCSSVAYSWRRLDASPSALCRVCSSSRAKLGMWVNVSTPAGRSPRGSSPHNVSGRPPAIKGATRIYPQFIVGCATVARRKST
jgi:type IV pilus assembly protein PilB